jgi:hypothetical protein
MNGNILTESPGGVKIEASGDIVVKDWIVSGLPDGTALVNADAASRRIVEEGNVTAP